jgi:hypothetical protein
MASSRIGQLFRDPADHRNIEEVEKRVRQYRVAAGAAAGKRVGPVLSASTRRLFVCLARRLDDVFEPEAFPDGAGASGPENLPAHGATASTMSRNQRIHCE